MTQVQLAEALGLGEKRPVLSLLENGWVPTAAEYRAACDRLAGEGRVEAGEAEA